MTTHKIIKSKWISEKASEQQLTDFLKTWDMHEEFPDMFQEYLDGEVGIDDFFHLSDRHFITRWDDNAMFNVIELELDIPIDPLEQIKGLPREGQDCNCGKRDEAHYIHEGEFPEIMSVCLNCGGYCT